MKNILGLCFIILMTLSPVALAWDHAIDLGYGYSHDPNNVKYNNSGILLSGDLLPINQTDYTHWSLNGALGRWFSSAPKNKNLTTVALSVVLRLYPFTVMQTYPAYLLGSVGPAYLSSRHFGTNTQAWNLAFQTNAGLGVEYQHFDVNLRFSHFSNAYLGHPNEGFNVLYLLSIGYLF